MTDERMTPDRAARDYSWLRIGVEPLDFGLPIELRGYNAIFAVGYTNREERVLVETKATDEVLEDRPMVAWYIERELNRAASERPGRQIQRDSIRASKWDGVAPPTEIALIWPEDDSA